MCLQNYTKQLNTFGILTFSNGDQITCRIDIKVDRPQLNLGFGGSQRQYGGSQRQYGVIPTSIEVKIEAPFNINNLQLFMKLPNKIDGVFNINGYSMCFFGLQIRNMSQQSNGDIDVDGICDYYQDMYDETVNKRIMREKKLKRILGK